MILKYLVRFLKKVIIKNVANLKKSFNLPMANWQFRVSLFNRLEQMARLNDRSLANFVG